MNSGDQCELTASASEKDAPKKNLAANCGMVNSDPSSSTQVKLQKTQLASSWDCLGKAGLIPFVISGGRDWKWIVN